MGFVLGVKSLPEVRDSISLISSSIGDFAKLYDLYDKFDGSMNRLDIFDGSSFLMDSLSLVVMMSSHIDCGMDFRANCDSIASNSLDKIQSLHGNLDPEYLSSELKSFFGCVCASDDVGAVEVFSVERCSELYERAVNDCMNRKGHITKEVKSMLFNLWNGWYRRFELLSKVLLYISCKWFTFDLPLSEVIVLRLSNNGVTKELMYEELGMALSRSNLLEYYLRLLEFTAFAYTKPCHSIGNAEKGLTSADFIFKMIFNTDLEHSDVSLLSFNGFSDSNELLETLIKRVVNIKNYVSSVVKIWANIHNKENDNDEAVLELTEHKTISQKYLRKLIYELLSKLFGEMTEIWSMETSFINGLSSVDDFSKFLENCNILDSLEDEIWREKYILGNLTMLEGYILDFVRGCVSDQCEFKDVDELYISGIDVMAENGIRRIDKKVIGDLISYMMRKRLGNTSDAFGIITKLDWANGIESSHISNNIYLVSLLIFEMVFSPAIAVYELHKRKYGKLSVEGVSIYIDRHSKIIENCLTLFTLLTSSAFRDFVLSIPQLVGAEAEELRDLCTIKKPLTLFLLFLSNIFYISKIAMLLPYLAQDSFYYVFKSKLCDIDDCDFNTLSKLIEEKFHYTKPNLSILKLQDYVLTQLTAFGQQCLHKIITREANSLQENPMDFVSDLIKWIIFFKSNCETHLPKALYGFVMLLAIDLCYSTLPDVLLDFFDLSNYHLAETTLLGISSCLERVRSSLECVSKEITETKSDLLMLPKFQMFQDIFRHNYSILHEGGRHYTHRDLNRLAKLIKYLESNSMDLKN